ncbi:MAG: carbohydrate binding domain-containing protein, partial [Prevotella sp.]
TTVTGDNCTRLCFNLGKTLGNTYLDDVEVYYIEAEEDEPADKEKVVIVSYNFEDGILTNGWGNSSTREIVDGEGHDGGKCEKINNPSVADNSWDMQAAIDLTEALTEGQEYVLHFWAKSDTEITVGAGFQNPSNYNGRGDFPSFTLTTEWKEYTLKTTVTGDNCTRLCFNLGKTVGNTYFDDIEIYYEKDAADEPESATMAKVAVEETDQTVTLTEPITVNTCWIHNDNVAYTFESATGEEVLKGEEALIKSGTNKVVLNIDNQIDGGTMLANGVLAMTKYVSETQLGKIIKAAGGAIDFSYNTNADAYPTVASRINVEEEDSVDIYTSRYCYWMSPLEGKGNINLYCGGERTFISTSKGAAIPDWSTFSGTVNLYPYKDVVDNAGFYGIVMGHGGMVFNPEEPAEKANEIFKNATLILNEGTTMGCESGTRGFRIGELQMAKDSRICGYYKANTPVSYFIVGGLGTDAALEGQIAPTEKDGVPYIEQGVGLIKEGAGTYTLTNNNNMLTAGLRILDGRILISNDKAEAAEKGLTGATGYTKSGTQTFVFGNGVLGGNGNLAGDVDVYGKIEPGCDGIGTLTLKNYAATDKSVSLYVRPSTVIECEIESAESYDQIEVDGNVTFYNITENFTESENMPVVKPILKDGFTYKTGEEYVLISAKGKTSLNDIEWAFDVEKPEGEWIVEERIGENGYQLVLRADTPNAISGATSVMKSITAAKGIIYVSCDEPTEVEIYSASGCLLKTVTAQRGMNAIPAAKGMLIIKAGDMTGKVVNE